MTTTNANELAAFGLSPTLSLKDGSLIESLSVVRHVPKRRCVCRAVWQGQRVYVKLFFGDKAKHYAERDIDGIEYFYNADILTPQILLTGPFEPAGFALVLEDIVAAKNAEQVWLASPQKQLKVSKQLMQTLASHHQAGLVQTDMYLKNFLVEDEKIYSIDGDGVRSYGAITNGKALANLSQLLSKFDVLMLEKHLEALLAVYGQARSWVVHPNTDDVKAGINAARIKATNAYADKKVFRQCTDVDVVSQNSTYIAISSEYSALATETKETLNRYFQTSNLIKDGNTCTVAHAEVKEHDVVIKRYNIKSVWHGIGRALRPSRAAASWSNAHRLQLLEIATPKPIALLEQRVFGFLRGRAFFLSEFADAPDIDAFFGATTDKQLRSAAVKHTVELFYRLSLLKLSHGDMKQTNIKMLSNGMPLLIDLDSMQQHKRDYFAKKAHVRDLKRFMQNWKEQPSLYNAFVKVFKVVYADHAPLQAAQILE